MSIKSILVPVSGDGSGPSALAAAATVANRFASHIHVLHVRREFSEAIPPGFENVSGTVWDRVISEVDREVAERSAAARAAFDALLAEKGIALAAEPRVTEVPTAAWQAVTGNEAELVGRMGGGYDLIVVGRRAEGAFGGIAAETAEAGLLGTGRAVLLAPQSAAASIGDSVLIAWNRSVQSARALRNALPFLRQAGAVTLLSVTTGARDGPSPQAIARNLAWHGIAATIKEVPPDYRYIGEQVLDEAKEVGADMVVMGAYSHSRVREMMLGGVTRHILEHADMPVFIAH
jgi:nucleotide-binding universal stress UspA family protein